MQSSTKVFAASSTVVYLASFGAAHKALVEVEDALSCAQAARVNLIMLVNTCNHQHPLAADEDGLWGLARGVRKENETLANRCVATHLLANLAMVCSILQTTEPELWIRRGQHMMPRLREGPEHATLDMRSPIEYLADRAAGSSDALITGGTGGLGLACARWLVQGGEQPGCVYLASRSGTVTPQTGGRLTCMQIIRCDVAQYCDLMDGIAGLECQLNSVWHAAGINADALLSRQDWELCCCVFAPKVVGMQYLVAFVMRDPLAAQVMFSSAAALLGNVGQSNYGAANSCLDSRCLQLRANGKHGYSLQWGPWAESGMAKNLGKIMHSMGFSAMSTADGSSALLHALSPSPHAVLAVMGIEWKVHIGGRPTPSLLRALHVQQKPPRSLDRASDTRPVPIGQCKPSGLSVQDVLAVVQEASGSAIDADAPLMDAGLDSLAMVEVRRRLQNMMIGSSEALPTTLLFDEPTVREVVRYLESLAPQRAPVVTPGQCKPSGLSVQDVLAVVQEASGSAIDADAPLMDAGLDSLAMVEVRRRLQNMMIGSSEALPTTLLFDEPTVREVVRYLESLAPQRAPIVTPCTAKVPSKAQRETVAICGISSQLPGGASTLSTNYAVAASSSETVGCAPASRYVVSKELERRLGGLDPLVRQRLKWLSALHGLELFDTHAFGLGHAEAVTMDPVQKLLLERCDEAFCMADLSKTILQKSDTAVFVGHDKEGWMKVVAKMPSFLSAYACTSYSSSVASGRISFTYGLLGASVTISTACSSALTSTHFGCQAAQQESNWSLVGTCNEIVELTLSTALAIASMTSPAGACHTWDANADGFLRAEYCGVAVLDVDHTEGAFTHIAGTSVQQDGRSASLTAPNGNAQQALIQNALIRAGATQAQLLFVEAHGTGTALGDPIEVGALHGALATKRASNMFPLNLESFKANLGHCEASAAGAGIVKAALALAEASSFPNAQLRTMNPHVLSKLCGDKVVAATQLAPLHVSQDGYGGVSSLGYSGTIAHAVAQAILVEEVERQGNEANGLLQDPPDQKLFRRRSFSWRDPPHPFAQRTLLSSVGVKVFRAPTAGALRRLVVDHVVQGRVLFPGAGYLELARACSDVEPVDTPLRDVFFLQPLDVDVPRLYVHTTVDGRRFQIQSSAEFDQINEVVHCTGMLGIDKSALKVHHSPMRAFECLHAVDLGTLYDGFDAVGLEYGPAYRTLMQAWGSTNYSATRLQARLVRNEMLVQPSDLDDALCSNAIIGSKGNDGEAKLPFALDYGLLRGAPSKGLWAVSGILAIPSKP